jgi:hypothetical protein
LRLIDRADHAKAAYAHRLHDADLSHPGLYDLIVATDKLGIEDVADVVTAFLAITRLQGATLSPEGSAGSFGEGEAADTADGHFRQRPTADRRFLHHPPRIYRAEVEGARTRN